MEAAVWRLHALAPPCVHPLLPMPPAAPPACPLADVRRGRPLSPPALAAPRRYRCSVGFLLAFADPSAPPAGALPPLLARDLPVYLCASRYQPPLVLEAACPCLGRPFKCVCALGRQCLSRTWLLGPGRRSILDGTPWTAALDLFLVAPKKLKVILTSMGQ